MTKHDQLLRDRETFEAGCLYAIDFLGTGIGPKQSMRLCRAEAALRYPVFKPRIVTIQSPNSGAWDWRVIDGFLECRPLGTSESDWQQPKGDPKGHERRMHLTTEIVETLAELLENPTEPA